MLPPLGHIILIPCQPAHCLIAVNSNTNVLFLSLVGVLVNNNICLRHDIAEILLKLALNTNQLINQFKYQAFFLLLL
jgi:hypothetical protein